MPRRLALAIAVGTAALGVGCGGGSVPSKPGVVRVVAAENFWGDIAEQIGGRHVEVTSIISNPNSDPHLFESDPRTAGAIATAQVVIETGIGYDPFMDNAIAAVGYHGQRIVSAASSMGALMPVVANPHLWYWTARIPRVAHAIAKQLSAIDPSDEAYFAGREAHFVRSLAPIRRTIAEIRHKYADAPVGYTERLPGYLLDAAGLKVASPESFAQAIEDGNDPSPGDLLTFERDIRDHTIKVLIYNAQVQDAATERLKQLAVSSGVPVVGMTETMPSTDASFQAWQLRQARELLRALGG
ncbi:MAG TPA: zinc ABC transporter substrate-binding protein [Mycobacteriales bacterium]|jgi:zinc/manganese transport system substrate-binding protein|nr:zinc ABC transporter substrate-binding protein [Mycobacteriales bacterium]